MLSEAHARRSPAPRAKRLLTLAAILAIVLLIWFRGGDMRDVVGKQYEYEEDLTIGLDGSASLTINGSIPALVALRGLDLDIGGATIDRDRVRAAYECPVAQVAGVPRPWRRRGRLFVQINLEIADIRRAHECAALSWSRYELRQVSGTHLFRQMVGPSALKPGTLKNVGWNGSEIVAFRVHLPSRILEHNARDLEKDEPTGVLRGNIIAWEQHLADRLDGRPVEIEVRMESDSILYRTLFLFAGAFGAALLTLAALIWWTVRRGRVDPQQGGGDTRRADRS